ncbi:MAG TPA: PIG-L family deacetylase [Thermomicrobiales bacterium]|nr:PIG-L family deacetylase [Thermomicrobiales bacterium]
MLAVGSHPDDETMLAGGTLAWAARSGFAVHILSVTRGEGGQVGEPPVATRDQLGAAREAELRCAAAALGASDLTFLPYVDPLLDPAHDDPARRLFRIAAEPDEFARALVAVIRAVRPDVILTHGVNGEYGHPQHLYTHETALRAFAEAADPAAFADLGAPHAATALYTWAAYYPTGGDEHLERLLNQDDPADWLLDLSPELLDVKERAALCHRSQHALFRRRRPEATVREVLIVQESLRRAALRPGAATDPLAAALAASPLATRAGT